MSNVIPFRRRPKIEYTETREYVEESLRDAVSRWENDLYVNKGMLFGHMTHLRVLLRMIDRDEARHV